MSTLAGLAVLQLIVGALPSQAADQILRSTALTSRGRTHGEVRLVVRGNARGVQVLLNSKVLRQVLGRIHEKERNAWPPERAGHEASQRYLTALEAVGDSIHAAKLRERRNAGARYDRRGRLVIEFLWSRDSHSVLLGVPLREIQGQSIPIAEISPLAQLDLPGAYVRHNILIIAAEHFELTEAEAARLLALGEGDLDPIPNPTNPNK
jgi:hypothetical protein